MQTITITQLRTKPKELKKEINTIRKAASELDLPKLSCQERKNKYKGRLLKEYGESVT